jgi:hypothetical protein
MSVINNVLRELENKPSSFTPLDASSIVLEENGKKSWPLISLVLFCVVSVMIIVSYLVNYNGFNSASKSHQFIPPTKQIAESVKVVEPVVEKFSQVTGLQINENMEFMELEFQLQNQSSIFLKERTGNNYIFHIKNTISGTRTPVLGQNPWLLKLSMQDLSDGLDVHFETRQGVLVETSSSSDQGQHNWVIKLKGIALQETAIENTIAPVELSEPETDSIPEAVAVSPPKRDSLKENDTPSEVRLDIKTAARPATDLQQLNLALRSYSSRDWLQAEGQFLRLLGGKQDRQARLYLIQLYQHLKSNKFEQLIQEGHHKYPADEAFQSLYANQLFRDKRYHDVIRIYQEKKSSADIINLLAASFQRTDQHEKAISHYLDAIRLDPEKPRLWISLGISQQERGQNKDALKSYQKALSRGLVNERLTAFLQQRIRLLSQE